MLGRTDLPNDVELAINNLPVIKKYLDCTPDLLASTKKEKQLEADKEKRLKKLRSSNPHDITVNLRQAVKSLSYEQAIEVTSRLDGLVSLLILITVIDELKHESEVALNTQYGIDTKGLCEKYEARFETKLDEAIKKKQEVNLASINENVNWAIQDCKQRIKSNKEHADSDEFKNLIRDYVFYISASKVYRITDELQEINWFDISQLYKAYKYSRQKIVQPYHGLQLGIEVVTIRQETVSQWREIATWLHGLHNRVYRVIAANPANLNTAGEVINKGVTINDVDAKLKYHKEGTTMYEMATYNRALAKGVEVMLRKVINTFTPHQSSIKGHPLAVEPVSASVPIDNQSDVPAVLSANEMSEKETPNEGYEIKITNDGSIVALTVSIPLMWADKDTMDRLKAYIDSAMHKDDECKLPNMLAKIMCNQVDDDAKIRRLLYCLETTPLTKNQAKLLGFIPGEVEARFVAYINSGNLIRTATFWGRSNHDLAKEYAEKIKFALPVDQIKYLQKLRMELITRGSHELKKIVDDILVAIFNQLLTNEMAGDLAHHSTRLMSSSN